MEEMLPYVVGFLVATGLIWLFFRVKMKNSIITELINEGILPNDMANEYELSTKLVKLILVDYGNVYDSVGFIFKIKYDKKVFYFYSTLSGKVGKYT